MIPTAPRRATLAVLALLALWSPAAAEPNVVPRDALPQALRDGDPKALGDVDGRLVAWSDIPSRVRLTPDNARLGQALRYRAAVLVTSGTQVRFEPPKSDSVFSWTQVRAGRVKPGWLRSTTGNRDSVWLEARLQIFEIGRHEVPGPFVQLSSTPRSTRPSRARLPRVQVTILPSVTAADSGAGLRALHGPVGAPWWERVPWVPVLLGLALLAALVVWLRRPRRRPATAPRPAPSPAPARPRFDPSTEALRALAALRAQGLPAEGRFAEHAFELTGILRRYLEATVATPRPGDTSGELLERLRDSRMPEDDYERLEGLLQLWDRVKFARAPLTEAEAGRCEEAVEAYVRRTAQARQAAARAAELAAVARAAATGRPGPRPREAT